MYAIFLWPNQAVYDTFGEIAPYFQQVLSDRGIDAPIVKSLVPGAQHLIFGANCIGFVPMEIPENSIIINFEQLFEGSPWISEAYTKTLQTHTVWDYHPENVKWMVAHGCNDVHLLNYGSSPVMKFTPNPRLRQDIDLLFIGAITGRRRTILDAITSELQTRNPSIRIAAPTAWGKTRETYILRSKLVLNIHSYDCNSRFEVTRVYPIAYNHRVMVTESSPDACSENNQWGTVLPHSSITHGAEGSLVDIILDLLANPEKIKQLQELAYQYAVDHPMSLPSL